MSIMFNLVLIFHVSISLPLLIHAYFSPSTMYDVCLPIQMGELVIGRFIVRLVRLLGTESDRVFLPRICLYHNRLVLRLTM